MQDDHNAIIARAAKEALQPLGFKRKGRSRTWLADRNWWLVVVEFQPSSWSKGSYLNVAAHWLWSHNDYLTFDFGPHRVAEFKPYLADEEFTLAACELAERAAAEAEKLIRMFPSVEAAAQILEANEATKAWPIPFWPTYHTGVAVGLAGRLSRAIELLGSIGNDRVTGVAQRMLEHAGDAMSFRTEVASVINRHRGVLGLGPPKQPVF